jgi:Hypoxia induced protein conserved region
MTTTLITLLAAMVVYWLVVGIIKFLKTTKADLESGAEGPSKSGLEQNRAMMNRVIFQALAIGLVIIVILTKR